VGQNPGNPSQKKRFTWRKKAIGHDETMLKFYEPGVGSRMCENRRAGSGSTLAVLREERDAVKKSVAGEERGNTTLPSRIRGPKITPSPSLT